MPAVSKAQQRFMGMVHAVKKGEMAAPSPEVAQAAASMKKKDAKDFASTKHKGLPEKKEVKEALRSSLLTDKKFMKKVDSEKKGKKKFSEFSKDMEAAKKRTYEVDKKTPYNVHKNTRYY
jgi:hypothetical protein